MAPVREGAAVRPDGEVHGSAPPVPGESQQCGSDGESSDSGVIKMNRKGRRKLQQATKKALRRAHECYSCCKADLEGQDRRACVGESDIFNVHLSQCRPDNEVSEVFSMPRIVPMAEKKGLGGGRPLGWDFPKPTTGRNVSKCSLKASLWPLWFRPRVLSTAAYKI